jgi:hypothetical protein
MLVGEGVMASETCGGAHSMALFVWPQYNPSGFKVISTFSIYLHTKERSTFSKH